MPVPPHGAVAARAPRVLIVCTANLCRSPMAEAVLRHRLDQRGVPATVTSAGLLEAGRPSLADARRALEDRGLRAAERLSRQLEKGVVRGADLVLGLERAHVREVVVLDPDAWPRTFTIKELVRRASAVGARRSEEPLAQWVARVHAGRRRADLLGSSPDDDVRDPTGGPPEGYDATADLLDALLTRFVNLAWGEGGS
ncbi:MAG: arsenate reductase/protein-tyrosine-phosphatase family protein [Actinomycetota bacterium]